MSDWSSAVCSSDLRLLNLITDVAWQAPWRPDRVAVTDYYLYRASPQGRLAYLSYGGRLAARAVSRRLRRRPDRKSGWQGKSVPLAVELGGGRNLKTKHISNH